MDEATKMGLSGLAPEGELPSLSDFAEEVGGAWPVGWYRATVIEGYATRKGKQQRTEDAPSNDGSSRNLWLCLEVVNGAEKRQMRKGYNYRPEDFEAERLEAVKAAREQFKNVRSWPGKGDLQRTSIAIGSLGQLEKATGKRLVRNGAGILMASPFVGLKLDVRLGLDDRGYNEVTQVAPAGLKVK